MRAKLYRYVATSIAIAMVCSCAREKRKYHTLKEKIDAESIAVSNAPASMSHDTDGYINVPDTKGHTHFLIPNRKNAIVSYPCSSCHTVALDKMKSSERGVKRAHWEVKIVHADNRTMACITCHSGDKMDSLKSLTNQEIDYNNSHMLCAQCHAVQAQDWKGGAHGKRVEGWKPPRRSLTCVNCHNPHKPQIQRRWPSRYNTSKLMLENDDIKGLSEIDK